MICFLLGFLLLGSIASTQTLTVGTATGQPGTVVRVPLTLSGATTLPAGLQWTIKYAKTVSIAQSVGPSASAAGKQLSCASTVGTLVTAVCLLSAVNTTTMSNGDVAEIDVTLPTVFSGTAGIAISGTLGASSSAQSIAIAGVSGKVSKMTSNAIMGSTLPVPTETRGVGAVVDKVIPVVRNNPPVRMKEGESVPSKESIACNWSDGLKCLVRLTSPVGNGGNWVLPFTSRCDLFSSEPIWVDQGQSSFNVNFKSEPGAINVGNRFVVGMEFGESFFLEAVSLSAGR